MAVKKRRFFKKKKKKRKNNKFFSYNNKDRRRRNFIYKNFEKAIHIIPALLVLILVTLILVKQL